MGDNTERAGEHEFTEREGDRDREREGKWQKWGDTRRCHSGVRDLSRSLVTFKNGRQGLSPHSSLAHLLLALERSNAASVPAAIFCENYDMQTLPCEDPKQQQQHKTKKRFWNNYIWTPRKDLGLQKKQSMSSYCVPLHPSVPLKALSGISLLQTHLKTKMSC